MQRWYAEDDLPTAVGAWRRGTFSTKQRSSGSIWGERSCGWEFSREGQTAQISLDYAFDGWHELTHCYLGAGWHITKREVLYPEGDEAWGVVRAMMVDGIGRQGVLHFSLFADDGNGVNPPASETAWLRVVPESDVMAMLDKHVVKAQADRDWARARLGLQAILERKPDSQSHQFAFAQLLREGGDIRSAAAMIARLAPLDRVGYPPAHLLLAEETIARYENASPQDDRQLLLKQAIHHLEAGASTRDPRWEYQLGVLYIDRGDMTLAELHLEQAAARGYSVADLLLSQLDRQRGNAAAAEQHRQAASKSLQSYIQLHPEDLEARLAWGRCLLDGGEWAALDALLAYLRQEGTDRRFRNRLGQLHLTAAEQYPRETQEMRQIAAGYALHAFDLLEEPSAAAWPLLQLASSPGTVPEIAWCECKSGTTRPRPASRRKPADC